MEEIKELSQQLNNLCTGNNAKINIHFNINGELLSLCEKINNDVNGVTNGFIRFGIKSIAVPHISIFMGYINEPNQLETMFENTFNIAQQIQPFRIDPTRLYFKSILKSGSQYLFLDFLQREEIMEHKIFFNNLYIDQITNIGWNFLDEVPHITMGCYRTISKSMCNLIEKYHEFPYCLIDEIGISVSGQKGMCLGELKSFKLSGK